MKQKGKTWFDSNGKEIPSYAVNKTDKLEEKEAHRLLKLALVVEKALKNFNEASVKSYNEVLESKIALANYKGSKIPTNSSGMTINSYDGTIEVKITKPDTQFFDKTFTDMVKQKFEEYFKSFGDDNEQVVFLRSLVNDLLFTSSGRLDNSKVLTIRKHADTIKNSKKLSKTGPLFIEAVDLFDKAIKIKPGNTGVYVEYSENPHYKKRKVALKITDI